MIIWLHPGSEHNFLTPGISRFCNHISFYHIIYSHTHWRIIQIQHVDLCDAYVLYFLFEDLFVKRRLLIAICLNVPGASPCPYYGKKKSEHPHSSSAPQTYSIICISSESCLGSIVGFARLLCFGTLRSAISAKVALWELLQLCPGSSGRAPQ